MTGIADDPLRTLRLCDSALESQHPDGIPRRVEASASDQLIRHARALSGLRPAPPPQFGIGGCCPSRSDGPPVAADLPRFAGIRKEGDLV